MKETGSATHKKITIDAEGIQSHYDLPVEFFAKFLGPRMAYSCAYFTNENNSLQTAELNKLKLAAQKLELTKSDRVLDIGCGWGSFLFFAAEQYGCEVVGITLSQNQVEFINEEAKRKRLSRKIKAELLHVYEMDFPKGYFDKAVTIGAIEHIEDLDLTFKKTHDVLSEPGLFLCHGMTKPWVSRAAALAGIQSEIGEIVIRHFGVGYWKSFWEVAQALEQSGFEVLDLENITPHYALTVARWLENLHAKEGEIAGKIVPDEKYREFVALMAGYIIGFEMSNTICNQILCQKQSVDNLRPSRPLMRSHMWVADDEEENRQISREVESSVVAEFRPNLKEYHEDAVIKELFEHKLSKALLENRDFAKKIDSILTFRFCGESGCSYTINVKGNSDKWGILKGEACNPDCLVEMDSGDFKKLIAQQRITPWIEAFKARKIRFSGSLQSALRIQSLIKTLIKTGAKENKRVRVVS